MSSSRRGGRRTSKPLRSPKTSKARPPTLTLETEAKLAAGGDALARHEDGRVVFVSGAAPEERVEVKVLKDNDSFLRAEVTRVLEPSSSRVEPPCPHFSTCGGCSLQHVAQPTQLESKQEALRDTLRRIGRVDPDALDIEPPWSGDAYGYRTRARLVISRDGRVGFRSERSRKVVDVRRCPVLAPELQDILTTLRAANLRDGVAQKGDQEVSLVSNRDVVLASFPRGAERVANTVGKASGPKILSGDDAIADVQDGFGALTISPRVFAQSNWAGNQALLTHLEAVLPEQVEHALDLYSGSGNFTRVLARRARSVEAIESAREAVALARRVAPENTTVHLCSVEDGLEKVAASERRPDLVLLDPPRAGVDAAVVQQILSLRPQTVIYVSCNPATFARDVARFEEGQDGARLRLRRVRLFDLYPQTGHSEVVGVLVSD